MKYAVISIQGKQLTVSEGDVFSISGSEQKVGSKVKIDQVLVMNDGKTITVGSPLVKNAAVTLEVLEDTKSEKIRVFKFKAKSRYRKTYGQRQAEQKVKVVSIG